MNVKERTELVFKCLEEQQHDPLRELIKVAKDNSTPLEDKISINKDLLQYIAPKLKAMDITVEANLEGEIRIVSYRDATQAEMDEHHKTVR